MKQLEKNSLLIIAGLVLFTIMFGIGGVPLLDPDEPVYAETAREMIQFNDFLSPRIFGNYWYDKPPMYYWLVAFLFILLFFVLLFLLVLCQPLPSAIHSFKLFSAIVQTCIKA